MKTQLSKVQTIQFQEIPVGGYFEYRGRRYLKLAICMACDEDRFGNIFHPQTEVLPDTPTLLFHEEHGFVSVIKAPKATRLVHSLSV